jgi:hypothetical protein
MCIGKILQWLVTSLLALAGRWELAASHNMQLEALHIAIKSRNEIKDNLSVLNQLLL